MYDELRVGGFDWAKGKDASGAEKSVGVFSWVDAMECAYELGEGEDFRVVSFSGWVPTSMPLRFSPCLAMGEGGMFAFEFQPPRLCASARDKKPARQTRQENPVP